MHQSSERPVILLIDDDRDALSATQTALTRRFGSDYNVIGVGSGEAAGTILSSLAKREAELAFVAAALWLPGVGGLDLLDHAHALHPGVVRALLVRMGDATAMSRVKLASGRGQADLWLLHGWESPEEWLYPQVQEALSAWSTAHRPRHEHVRIVGERWSPHSHELRDLMTRNTLPFGFYDADSPEGQHLLAAHGLEDSPLPVMIRFDGHVVVQPSRAQVAETLGVRTQPDPGRYDVIILGAGPAGLAAAVYAASEGLRTVVIEPSAIGGQAGSSSMIRNYPGFPRGVAGNRLTYDMFQQGTLLGAQFAFSCRAVGMSARGTERVVTLDDGTEVVGRSVIIATGVSYRRLDIPSVDRLIGMGVFYGAAASEASALRGQPVVVIGGANSAGQAALLLAKYASQVTILVRGASLATSMSDYLLREINASPNINVRTGTRVIDGHGEFHLTSLTVEHIVTGTREELPAAGAFVMIGALPRTEWLDGRIERGPGGYIRTGDDVSPDTWPLARTPYALETSMPGVFAIGDVRSNAVKRVVSAVGDGGVAVGQVHRYLATLSPSQAPAPPLPPRHSTTVPA